MSESLTGVRTILVEKIDARETQTREKIDADTVEDYSAAMKAGAQFDPLVVYRTDADGRYLLACGHHRLAAIRHLNQETALCIVREGSRFDALKAGSKDNLQAWGLRPTRKDKRHSAGLLLKERPESSDELVAEIVGLSAPTVASVRRELVSTQKILELPTRTGRDGKARPVRARVTPVKKKASKGTGTAPGTRDVPPPSSEAPEVEQPHEPSSEARDVKIPGEAVGGGGTGPSGVTPECLRDRIRSAFDEIELTIESLNKAAPDEPGFAFFNRDLNNLRTRLEHWKFSEAA